MKKLFALTLTLALCSLIGRVKPAHAYTCLEICTGEWTQCKEDCRFNPYPGCIPECNSEHTACLAGC
jgi:hypothetical protein